MTSESVDAVVIGAGPNGLVAANVLADAGWDVLVLEANADPGGAVRTAEVTAPGFRNDLFSAFYPLGAASPVMRSLELERHGLRWVRAPAALAHPTPDGPTAVLSTDIDTTAASLDAFAAGDGDAWRELYRKWERAGAGFLDVLLSPFPPVRGAARLAGRLGPRGLLEFTRFALLPVRRMADEQFAGAGGGLLLGGNALHADIPPDAPGSGMLGWMLASAGQQFGYPVPEGGAGSLTAALVARLAARGGTVRCAEPVVGIDVVGRRATGVRLAGGGAVAARRAVIADVGVLALYRELLAPAEVPNRILHALGRWQPADATVKIDWALSTPIPWSDGLVAGAGTVHIVDSMAEMSLTAAQLASGFVPERPFVLFGQMTTTDPTRSPPGTESAWAYTHVPQHVQGDAGPDGIKGSWDDRDTDAIVARVEDRIEAHAPGFRDLILARHVMTPPALEAADANLVGGDVNGGTAQLHQQFVFRPFPGLGRAETPVRGLYLGSASAHPGGGVHGGCGANAARAALWHDRLRRAIGAIKRS